MSRSWHHGHPIVMRPLRSPRLFLLWVLAVSGCLPVPIPQPTPYDDGELSTHGDPVSRLGRYTRDHRFEEVEPNSIPPSHLYVLVHGWAPGWAVRMREEPGLRLWRAVDEEGDPLEPWQTQLAEAITEADPHAVVVSFSWLEGAATNRLIFAQRRALARTSFYGWEMVRALQTALAPDFYQGSGRMHFIGHSYGARVATVAAVVSPKLPQHLTIFDSPDGLLTHVVGGHTQLGPLLRKLPIGREPGQVFVDNYVSMVGSRYHQDVGLNAVVDVVLSPPYGSLAYRDRHLYPMEFYSRTGGRGFGLGWSPFLSSADLERCYRQPYGELELVAGCSL